MITQEAYEYASSCSVYQTFRMSLAGQTHYLLLTATVLAIFPSRAGYIDQSGNPCTPPPHLPNPFSPVTGRLTNQKHSMCVTRQTIIMTDCFFYTR